MDFRPRQRCGVIRALAPRVLHSSPASPPPPIHQLSTSHSSQPPLVQRSIWKLKLQKLCLPTEVYTKRTATMDLPLTISVFQGSPFDINGGACVAMVGKDCVAIACDLRLGMQALTISNNFPKIFNYAPSTYLGLTGLATDVNTVSDLFRYKVNMYRLREERHISPQTLANLVSSSLYEKRFGPFFVSPVIAGINPTTGKPFICGFDSIGCIDFAKDFIVSGTASDQLFGTCEGLWEPDLGPEDLFETISQALLSAVDRDALSGWGAQVYIIEKDKVTQRLLKGRQD
ncbi:Proteasome subunit beta type-3 [Penicillium oxalicum]|uniref:Proteasome subunit beta type-3 n=1 Tax=Penicillium oxalicum TaxID=69781 RepID=UPI0020B6965A|nr:Proteasome subunit beta type-3 [Penicillium oxalicum]KAI2787433.1 Proteasome subunit beta type-3 [Penicillium oxalicum]